MKSGLFLAQYDRHLADIVGKEVAVEPVVDRKVDRTGAVSFDRTILADEARRTIANPVD